VPVPFFPFFLIDFRPVYFSFSISSILRFSVSSFLANCLPGFIII
jgi:hypothetical protein